MWTKGAVTAGWLSMVFQNSKHRDQCPFFPSELRSPPAGQRVKAPTLSATAKSGWFVPGGAPGADTQRALSRTWRAYSSRRLQGRPTQTTTPNPSLLAAHIFTEPTMAQCAPNSAPPPRRRWRALRLTLSQPRVTSWRVQRTRWRLWCSWSCSP